MVSNLDRVAVDLDDVVLDLTGGLRTTIEGEFDIELPPFEEWDLNKVLKPILGRPWMKYMRDHDWLWATFPAVAGAIGGIDTLRRAGFYLECVTSKPEWAESQVWKWLSLWRPAFQRVTIVGMDDSKADFTDAAWLIDDKPKNIEEFIASRPGRSGLLFTRSHNAQIKVPKSVRVDSWRAIVDHLMKARSEQEDEQ